uniref:histone deacetylase 8-like isoform X2 n=1 Tax=Styela clava TaxID=7725 RepID=UPI00193A2CCA|nr:histone deacetylase 8-like isoform X2 [Styela clava]
MAKPEPIAYIWHKDYVNESDRYIPTTNRNVMVHSLIEAYGLLDNMMTVTPKKASIQDLAAFHSMDYLNFLSNPDSNRDEDSINDETDDYGLEYDCPIQDGIIEYCQRVAGGTIEAARMLNNGFCKTAIHWLGGGGGYNPANTARSWTSVTASLLGKEISEDIPEHEYFLEYGPHYELPVSQSLRKDLNTSKYIEEVVSFVGNNLEQIN